MERKFYHTVPKKILQKINVLISEVVVIIWRGKNSGKFYQQERKKKLDAL